MRNHSIDAFVSLFEKRFQKQFLKKTFLKKIPIYWVSWSHWMIFLNYFKTHAPQLALEWMQLSEVEDQFLLSEAFSVSRGKILFLLREIQDKKRPKTLFPSLKHFWESASFWEKTFEQQFEVRFCSEKEVFLKNMTPHV